MIAEKIRKELSRHCSACKYNACFREDECVGCMNNSLRQLSGNENFFILREDLEEELQVIEGTPRQSKPLKIISNFKAKTQYIGKIQNSTKA